MSLHQITMSRTSAGDLNLIFLDQGQPFAFTQTADGVWHPRKAEAAGPVKIPNPKGVSFAAIKGLIDGYGLLALDVSGALWYITQQGSTWNAGGFTRLSALPGKKILDFDICEVRGFPLFLAFIAQGNTPGVSNVFTQTGSLAKMSPPVVFPYISATKDWLSWASIAVAGLDPRDSGGGDTPIAVAVGALTLTINTVQNSIEYVSSQDAVNWQKFLAVSVPRPAFLATVAALVPGYPWGFLQAVVLDLTGTPYLYTDDSGTGSNFVPYSQNHAQLPNPQAVLFSKMAAAIGSDANLQVVGLGRHDGLPYLMTQSAANAAWNAYQNPSGQGMQLPMTSDSAPPLTDLAMGYGNQGLLQVGYLGANGVYVNFQDSHGNWGWFGPLPGA